jgi:DNA-binding SARP family transcriptional activator
MSPHELHVRLLGGFEVVVDGQLIPEDAWRRRRAAGLVKLLLLAPGHRMVRELAIEALWPGIDKFAGGRNLRKAAHYGRQTLGLPDAIVLDGTTVALLPGGRVKTDVEEFDRDARRALDDGDERACRAVAERYAGDLLPDDRYEPWSDPPRQRLHTLYHRLLERGRLWGLLLSVDPTSELAHRAIIRERMEAGDRAGAIRQFDHLRSVLRDELGVSPDPESVALYEEALEADGGDVVTPGERARALLAWGMVHWEREDLAEAERTAQQARALAIDAGLGRELAEASELLGLVGTAQGRWREVFAEGFLDAVKRSPHLAPFVYDANLCMSEFALHEPGGLAAVGAFADELIQRASEDSRPARAVALLLRGEVGLLGDRDLVDVEADLTEALRLHHETETATGAALATMRLAELQAHRATHEAAAAYWAQARRLAAETPLAGHLLPLLFGMMIDLDDAVAGVATLDEAEEALAELRACEPCSMSLIVRGSVVCARTGQHERAQTLLDRAAHTAQRWRGGPWQAALAEARGVIAQELGDEVGAVAALFEQAAAGFEAAGRPRDAARVQEASTG